MENLNFKHSEITQKIIHCFFKVYNNLGYGFLEKVYENALIIEFEKCGLKYHRQKGIKVYYDGNIIGSYTPDIIVENIVVVENKSAVVIHSTHEDQLRNALKATEMEVGLLLNFGIKPEFKRKVFANEFKK